MNSNVTHPKMEEDSPRDGKTHEGAIVASSSSGQSDSITLPTAASRTWRQIINPLKKKTTPSVPEQRGISGEYRASILSILSFQWIQPLLVTGYQRPLELNDIWHVNPVREVDVLSARFKEFLAKRKTKATRLDPLLWAIYDTFTLDLIVGGTSTLIAGCLQILTPFVLRYLIQYVQDAYNATSQDEGPEAPSVGRGIGIVVGIACMQLLQSLCTNQFFYRGMLLGGQTRSVLISCIFEKSLKLSGRAKMDNGDDEGWTNARVVNLMSTDTSRIDSACISIHRCWVAPIQVALALALLLVNLTYSALVGFALICAAMPILGRAIGVLMVRRKAINKVTDQRVHLTQEIFSTIRMVKLFAWEPKLLGRLRDVRKIEIRKISALLALRNAILAAAIVLPIIASMLTFITYSLTGHPLDAAPIFSSLALFNSLGVPLEILPVAIGRLVDALASVKRISRLLDAEELQGAIEWSDHKDSVMTVEDCEFTWEQTLSTTSKENPGPNSQEGHEFHVSDTMVENAEYNGKPNEGHFYSPFRITNLSFSVGRKEFIAVIGPIGSGKSSLLLALAGEMRKTRGHLTIGASNLALCAQQPWVQNSSIKENVIFGQGVDEKRYRTVLSACALDQDIESLPDGDATEIGERGVTISGGQKQRINLARAVYFNASILLLDDPLSAVDAHVGNHIIDNVLCGLLREKCCILATHQLRVLPRTDRIVWMKSGSVHKIASYADLIQHDEEFQTMMMETASRETREDAEPGQESQEESIESNGDARPAANATPEKTLPTALMRQEERNTGSVPWVVYGAFIKASGTMWNLPIVLGALAVAQGANILTNLWLSWWTSMKFRHLQTPQYIGIYAALGVFQAVLMFTFATTLTTLSSIASKTMLNRAVSHTLAAPMAFFDTTPAGRLMNVFSKDVDTMDNRLQDDLRFFLFIVATMLSVFALVISYYHYFAIVLFPLALVFLYAASYYRASAREIKRHEAALRGHLFARFGEAINGAMTIRAYAVQETFRKTISASLDSMNGAYYLTFAGQRWLSIRLDAVGTLLIFTVGILIVTSRFHVSPSIGGLVLSYMLSIVQLIQQLVHVFADVQNEMNSTERVYQYGHSLLQEEHGNDVSPVDPKWPEKGAMEFSDVQMRYRSGLPLALKGLSFSINAGEKIGIVGRTGSGKSSIIASTFRLVDLFHGTIIIDGLDIASLPLQQLRSSLSIIPQDPVLFKGTIRSNLDPFDEHEDLELWEALRYTGLLDRKSQISDESALALDSAVEDEGHNFSLGQRQLLALARALVRKSKITFFDEATSSVDFETDRKVQQIILKVFKGRTLLCIAHRLNTVIGYDRILVMENGAVAEFDTPTNLYDAEGIFRKMCDGSGITRDELLIQRERASKQLNA